MRQRTRYPHGVPCWVETERPDPHAAMRLYSEVFGSEYERHTPPA